MAVELYARKRTNTTYENFNPIRERDCKYRENEMKNNQMITSVTSDAYFQCEPKSSVYAKRGLEPYAPCY